jgi:putative (di)nucleoside polyphosphate hydrolase|tara:strand:- start:105 stop:590 length:486 start_codon:yes stop_codon:yes gene_type:complete
MNDSGYRLNVGLIVANKQGKVLLCKRKGVNSWQFPQGGIDYAENSLKAAKRELLEEVGIRSKSIKLIESLDDWLKYDVPRKKLRKKIINRNFKGQKQKWFLFMLKEDVEITFENDPDNEFDDFKWVSYWYPLNVIISFKEKVYREALNKLKYSFCKEFNNV